jgi:hypothetical protein
VNGNLNLLQGEFEHNKMLFRLDKDYRKRTCMDYKEDCINMSYGLKGPAALMNHIEFPNSFPLDYLHLISEGVFSCLSRLWFDSSNKEEEFYISEK